jgi:putative nucleotidyltransferase with HDIG domain
MNTATPSKDLLEVLQRRMHQERQLILNPAKQYLDDVAGLPPAPILVTELLTLFQDPNRDIDQVIQLISYEPALTAQILRTCNSVYFGGDQPPEDIFEAVSKVGFYQVYCMVVSLFASKTKSMEGADKALNVDQLWRHSVAVAVSASVVAEETGQTRELGFTAGLLHDIGKLVLASAERGRYAALIQRAKDEGASVRALERSSFAIDHAELGGELMDRWKLPQEVVAAVRHHHDLDPAPPHEQRVASVHIGNIIAHQLLPEDLANTDFVIPSTAALGILQLTSDDLPRLFYKAQAEMEKVKGMLEI